MPAWGNKDTKTVSGTVSVTNGSATVTGSSTTFTNLKSNQVLVIAGVQYPIKEIASNTSLSLMVPYAGSTASGLTVTANEKPVVLAQGDLASVFGVDTTEAGVAANKGMGHAGWVKVKNGSGPVVSVTITDGGTGYESAPTVTFSSGTSTATGTATINAEGVVTGVTVTAGGLYSGTAPTITFSAAPEGGTDAAATAVMGGRFGRKSKETLVAMGVPAATMGDAEDTIFPDS